MFVDIVFPKNNEKEFVEIAGKLGIRELVFVYPYSKDLKNKELEKFGMKTYLGVLADSKTAHKAKNIADLILVESSDKDRFVFEKSKPDIIFNLEFSERGDFIHHRNSGLNQVLCKLSNANKIAVGFNIGKLIDNHYRALGRVSQNIRFCRKYKVNMILSSFAKNPLFMRAGHDLSSLAQVLGMHPKEAQDSLEFISKKLKGKT